MFAEYDDVLAEPGTGRRPRDPSRVTASPELAARQSPRVASIPRTAATRPATAAAVALGLLTALALGLRVVGMDQTLYGDEYFTYGIITRNGLRGVWHDVYHTSVTPPLHYYLAWSSVQFGGDSTVLVRLPSLIFGTALVPLVYLLARRTGGRRAGLLAAAMIALSPFAIWYSDEARAYATMMFLVALSALALLRAAEGDGRAWWVVFAVSACAAVWSHYTAVFVIAGQAAWALWAHRDRWRPLAVAVTAIVVGYLPWVPGFLEQRQNKGGLEAIDAFAPLNVSVLFELPLRTLIGHPFLGLPTFPGATGLLLAVVVVFLAVAALARRPQLLTSQEPLLRPELALWALLILATPIGLLLYAASGTSLFLPRNLSASLPALAVLVAVALAWMSRALPARVAAVTLGAFVVLLGFGTLKSLRDAYRRPPYREAASYVNRVAPAGEAIIETPLALTADKRLKPTTVDLYVPSRRRVYRNGAASTWGALRRGRSVSLVSFRQILATELVKGQLHRGERAPPGLLERLGRLGGPDGRAVLRAKKSFPGIIPVDVLRYRGMLDGRLERHGGNELISWSFGKRVRVSAGAARGAVEGVTLSSGNSLISGWAVDAAKRRPAQWILLFTRDRLLAVAGPGGRRPDLARRYGESALLSGFGTAPNILPGDRSTLRVFAVVGKRASELPLSPAARRSVG